MDHVQHRTRYYFRLLLSRITLCSITSDRVNQYVHAEITQARLLESVFIYRNGKLLFAGVVSKSGNRAVTVIHSKLQINNGMVLQLFRLMSLKFIDEARTYNNSCHTITGNS